MKIIITLHREYPTTEALATREIANPKRLTVKEAGVFLTEAIEKITATIEPGEHREVGIGVKVDG